MVFKLKMTGANCVLLCAALFSSSLTAYATEKSADSMADSSASGVVQGKIAVSGTVKDKNGEPLIGVSVVEKGTTNGMITDLDGNFGLSVSSPEAVLEFSYVGYNPVSVKIGDRTFFAIEMGESTQNLDEVVVTALGIKREKKMLGYAVQDIKADKLNTTGDPSVIGALSGKVAGLQMNTAGTGLSGSTKITLRGNSSLTDNNQPLWVVDGVPFSDNSSSDASLFGGVDRGGSAVDINPEDIESISVLKGPNAAALYGSRAGNGVILITTKRGVKEKGFGVTYSGNFTWTSVASSLEQQTTYGQGKGGVFDPNVFESFGAPLDGHTYTGWLGQELQYKDYGNKFDQYFNTGFTQTHNVAIGKAEDLFKDGIRESFNYYHMADSADIYIDRLNIYNGTQENPFAGSNKEAQLEQIITQKWLAVFPNGNEGWAEFRRTDYPRLNNHLSNKDPNIANGKFIKRVGYSTDEYAYNIENVPEGVNQSTRVWWDVQDTNNENGERNTPNNFR